MWALLSARLKTALILCTGAAIATPWAYLWATLAGTEPSPPAWTSVLRDFAASAGGVFFLGLVLGQFRWFWRLSARAGLHGWFPDLNGVWTGNVESSAADKHPGAGRRVTFYISQTWGRVQITEPGIDGQSKSNSLVVAPDKRDGVPALWVISRGQAVKESPTDAQEFFIAALFEYVAEDDRLDVLYWTNRNWMAREHTAGRMTLKRSP